VDIAVLPAVLSPLRGMAGSWLAATLTQTITLHKNSTIVFPAPLMSTIGELVPL